MSETPQQDTGPVAELYRGLRETIGGVVVGQEEAVRLCFVTLALPRPQPDRRRARRREDAAGAHASPPASASASAACSSRRT